jgi:hypothetical protein
MQVAEAVVDYQKPTEWIQELESKLSNATPEQLAEWKEKYFKVEPAWSEEDEDMRYKAMAVLNRLCSEGKEYVWSIETLKKLFYWLKSLKDRYTWKPSNEQMAILWDAIGNLKHDNYKFVCVINELYNDLKKLTE